MDISSGHRGEILMDGLVWAVAGLVLAILFGLIDLMIQTQ